MILAGKDLRNGTVNETANVGLYRYYPFGLKRRFWTG